MIIVTGGAGFIGSNLVASLEQADAGQLVVSDLLGHDDKWRNLAKRNLQDIMPPEALPDFLEHNARNIKAIFHMGAISSTTATDGDDVIKNNFRLSTALWDWCAANKVRFIYASSAATYGNGENGFDDHDTAAHLEKLRPLNLYGWSKNLFDRWVNAQIQQGRRAPPQCAGLKFFNVYGPNEYHKGNMRSVVHQIFPSTQEGKPFQLFKSHRPDFKDGGQLRDFIWVGDVVKVMLWLFDNPKVSGLFNVGTGQARSFADLAAATYRAAGKEPLIAYRDMPAELQEKYQYFTQANMKKLLAAGYNAPFTSLEEGVRLYVQGYLAKPEHYV
jgi:ADP-L-glycero-D-manno-heptose 6-epimerase